MTFEEALEVAARKYAAALRKRGQFISIERAMEEVDAAHRNAGKAVRPDFYIPDDTLTQMLEDAYGDADE